MIEIKKHQKIMLLGLLFLIVAWGVVLWQGELNLDLPKKLVFGIWLISVCVGAHLMIKGAFDGRR